MARSSEPSLGSGHPRGRAGLAASLSLNSLPQGTLPRTLSVTARPAPRSTVLALQRLHGGEVQALFETTPQLWQVSLSASIRTAARAVGARRITPQRGARPAGYLPSRPFRGKSPDRMTLASCIDGLRAMLAPEAGVGRGRYGDGKPAPARRGIGGRAWPLEAPRPSGGGLITRRSGPKGGQVPSPRAGLRHNSRRRKAHSQPGPALAGGSGSEEHTSWPAWSQRNLVSRYV